MKKTQIALAMLVATGLTVAPFAAEAKSHKAKHQSSTSSQTTTGANMKSNSSNPSSQGNAGPGTNQGGSMPSNSDTSTKTK